MQDWQTYILYYLAASGWISQMVYLLLPRLARMAVAGVVHRTCETVADDLRQRRSTLLKRGQEMALSGPQRAIVGHLIDPYLEKLTSWIAERMNDKPPQQVTEHCIEACLTRVHQNRWKISLIVAQAVMVPLTAGFLLRGVI